MGNKGIFDTAMRGKCGHTGGTATAAIAFDLVDISSAGIMSLIVPSSLPEPSPELSAILIIN